MGKYQVIIFSILAPVLCIKEIQEMDLKKIDLTLTDDLTKLSEPIRLEKSLLNSFPFTEFAESRDHENHGDHGDHAHHGDHGDQSHNEEPQKQHSSRAHAAPRPGGPRARLSLIPGLSRQYGEVAEDPASTFTEVAASGKKCIDKVELVEETEYDTVITCDHSYDQRCHTSYTTGYDAVQEEECEENYRKVCFIEMVVIAFNETTNVCKKPLVKDCDVEGEPVCRTEYQSECWTKQIPHEVEDDIPVCKTVHVEMCKDETVGYTTNKVCEDWPHEECEISKEKVTKYTPMTGCEKVPTELCAPAGCGFKEGAEECHPVTKTVVAEKPEETCTLEPQRTCKHVTKLVPKLTPIEECVDVPKEVCTRSRTNPRKIKKPVVKKWCYIPSDESGLS